LKIAADIVGHQAPAVEQRVDKRWLMAYSAGLGETQYPHPLFPVCYEWPATHALRVSSGLEALNARLVHAQHDMTVHRAPREGDVLGIAAQVVAAMRRKPGAYVVFRMTARDATGALVTITDFGVLYRGVPLEGGERRIVPVEDPPPPDNLQPIGSIGVAATAAHVYTECARIWNPIHTDPDYARQAGLPGIILHGTATLARSVSKALHAFKADARSVRRIQCRFSGMVLMPNTLDVAAAFSKNHISFETRKADGEVVVSRGRIELDG